MSMKSVARFAASLACMFAFVGEALADGVSYLTWDESRKALVPASIGEGQYTLVTSSTRTFEDGKWYVVKVKDDVLINDGGNITVNGSAHLILCDGASLTVKKSNIIV